MPLLLLSLPTALLLRCLAFLPWTRRLTVCSRLAKDFQRVCNAVNDHDHLLIRATFIAAACGGSTSALQWLCNVRSVSIGSTEGSAENDESTLLARGLLSLSQQASNAQRHFASIRMMRCSGRALHMLLSRGVPFEHLHSLWLYCTSADQDYCDYLAADLRRLPQLQQLRVSHCGLRSEDYRQLVALPRIRDMDLTNTWDENDDEALDGFQLNSTLRRLIMGFHPSFDTSELLEAFLRSMRPSVEQLTAGGGMQSLQLRAQFCSSSLTYIADIKSLTTIDFGQSQLYGPSFLSCFVTSGGAPTLPHLIHFVAIRSYYGDQYDDSGDHRDGNTASHSTVTFLNAYISLHTCELPLVDELLKGDAGVMTAAFALPHIKRLQLERRSGEPYNDDEQLLNPITMWPLQARPPQLAWLQSLSLVDLPLADGDLLTVLRACGARLRHLALFSCHSPTVDAWLQVADMAPNLISLEMCSGGMDLTQASWHQAVQRAPHFAHLLQTPATSSTSATTTSNYRHRSPFPQLVQLTVDLSRMQRIDVGGLVILIGLLSAAPLSAVDVFMPEPVNESSKYVVQLAALPHLSSLSARNLTRELSDMLARCVQPRRADSDQDGSWLRYVMERRVWGSECADDMDVRALQLTSSYTTSGGRFHCVWAPSADATTGKERFFDACLCAVAAMEA